MITVLNKAGASPTSGKKAIMILHALSKACCFLIFIVVSNNELIFEASCLS